MRRQRCAAVLLAAIGTSAAMKTQLGPLLSGVVLGDQWVPAPRLQFPGDVAYGPDGECAESRLVWIQFQRIKYNDLAQFMEPSIEVVLLPKDARSGRLISPYQAGDP